MYQSQNLKENDNLEDLGEDWRIILKRILQKKGLKVVGRFFWFKTGTSEGLLGHKSDESSCSITH
jgi:hypothetical protein